MLKFIMFTVLMIVGMTSWEVSQSLLFLGAFLLSFSCIGGFRMGCLGYCLGMDFVSYAMVLLSFWIMGLLVCASQRIKDMDQFPSAFVFVNISLLLSLVLSFSSLDYLLFYVCFESSLIPTMILVLGWGYQPERIQAGLYMLFYTLFASLPLLVSFLSLYSSEGTLVMGWGRVSSMGLISHVWYVCSVAAFMVKLPVFLGHLWLPKAHVEAPVAGSMILAGVLLKLGGYGLLRVLPVFAEVGKKYVSGWVSLGVVGGVFVSVMCMRQTDIKALIAYSSVAHMGLVMCGLVLGSWWGMSGAVAVMLGHGLCSSGMFCIANMMYERVGSRSLFISKGLLSFMPSMGLWWFLLSISNMASPPTLSLLGEICLITSVLGWSSWVVLGISVLSFMGAAYSLYLYSLTQHGKKFSSTFSCCSGKVREYLVLMLHWLPLNILIMKGAMFVG